MFTVGAESRVTTVSELKKDTKKTLEASREAPVYVLKGGKPVAALVSMEMVELLNEAREDRRLAKIAARRLEAIESREDRVLEEAAFWAAVERQRPPAK
ncbi:MAG TPA: type II toxin-antitoxin system prevent-host-death family antitoxin [Gemmatimonadaceae bacterium]|nr:type II toxin-antitoxin system prevent-host-death family antitoxin [Gemmatimonadaceae bacterium]